MQLIEQAIGNLGRAMLMVLIIGGLSLHKGRLFIGVSDIQNTKTFFFRVEETGPF